MPDDQRPEEEDIDWDSELRDGRNAARPKPAAPTPAPSVPLANKRIVAPVATPAPAPSTDPEAPTPHDAAEASSAPQASEGEAPPDDLWGTPDIARIWRTSDPPDGPPSPGTTPSPARRKHTTRPKNKSSQQAPPRAPAKRHEPTFGGTSTSGQRATSSEERVVGGVAWARSNEPFHTHGGFKVGIIGGPSSGKTYLFHAMVSRLRDLDQAGALAPFLVKEGCVELYQAGLHDKLGWFADPREFSSAYRTWQRLEATKVEKQEWYKLRLQVPTGLFGHKRAPFEVEYLDAAGERLRDHVVESELPIWARAFLSAQVLVFCLPMWVAFPRDDLDDRALEQQQKQEEDFFTVYRNLVEVRDSFAKGAIRGVDVRLPTKVQTILALTMADDTRSALEPVRRRWIDRYAERNPNTGRDPLQDLLSSLAKGAGCARYLESARRVSTTLTKAFSTINDADVRTIPKKLEGYGNLPPWIVPVSAVAGSTLTLAEQQIEQGLEAEQDKLHRMRFIRTHGEPRPLHVELPLVLGLCEQFNALM